VMAPAKSIAIILGYVLTSAALLLVNKYGARPLHTVHPGLATLGRVRRVCKGSVPSGGRLHTRSIPMPRLGSD
jgi:hypothetical protein